MRSRSKSSRSCGGGADTTRRRDGAGGGAADSSRRRFLSRAPDGFGTSGPFAGLPGGYYTRSWAAHHIPGPSLGHG